LSKILAVAGKGGTGKTTIAALLIRYLKQREKTPILAVDADADSNLPEALGMAGKKTIGTIGSARQEFFVNKGKVPAGMPKEAYLDLKLNQVLVESKDIDMLVMGRPEGPGCYCYINSVLRKHLEVLGKNYPYVIIDNEAGLEHLSRRTTQDIDFLIVVSDYSLNGLRAAVRIKELSEEMELWVKSLYLIVNSVPQTVSPKFLGEVEKTGVPFLGTVPEDKIVPQYDIEKRALIEISDSYPAVAALNQIAEKIFQDGQ
jgi:CO dehydrogenase maturation factor